MDHQNFQMDKICFTFTVCVVCQTEFFAIAQIFKFFYNKAVFEKGDITWQ